MDKCYDFNNIVLPLSLKKEFINPIKAKLL